MIIHRDRIFYIISILFVFLSSIRFVYLPEIQVLLITASLFLVSDTKTKVSLLFIVLCSHFFAVPDSVFRFSPASYPSIYTKVLLFSRLKGIDIIGVMLVIANVRRLRSIISILSLPAPWILVGITIVSTARSLITLESPALDQAIVNILYGARNYVVLLGTYLLVSDMKEKEDIIHIAYLASFTWIVKMTMAILIPAANPIDRELGIFSGIIYFAGDEYLTLPIYLAIILSCKDNLRSENFIHIILWIVYTLILCLIALRRGAIIGAAFAFLMVLTAYYNHHKTKIILSKNILIRPAFINILMNFWWSFGMNFVQFVFLLLVLQFLPSPIQHNFSVNYQLLASAIISVIENSGQNIYAALFGIGTGVPYLLHGLEEKIAISQFAWGAESESPYRTVLWYMPFGRLILNVGIIGSLIFIFSLISKVFTVRNFSDFYLLLSIYSLTFLDSMTPINAIAMALSLITLRFLYI